MDHAKLLVLGHGWRMMKLNEIPRCSPIELDEWYSLVSNAPTFMDMSASEEPDIVANVANDWSTHDMLMKGTFDYVVDTISHIPMHYKRSVHYWNGVKGSLKDTGVYIGWSDDRKPVRLSKHEVRTRLETT